MNILHVNTFDLRGGAARAVRRIHIALQKIGINSSMIVAKKNSDDENVKKFYVPCLSKKKWLTKKLQTLSGNISYSSFNLFDSWIHKEINKLNADIVHLHWIGNELINISEIKKIKKPIVWTLHDMWAFCGAEHYDDINNSGQYRSGYREKKTSLNAMTWRRKRKHWRNVNFHFISPSFWLAKCLQESCIFRGKEARVIRNCLNIKEYYPIDRKIAREKINLSTQKRIILFGADGKNTNLLKGFQLLEDSFNLLDRQDIQFVIFGGESKCLDKTANGVDVVEIGKITDDDYLAALFSASDVFVIPSIIDNYPNTVLEAMSCGTPCVGFKVGGIPEMIDHKVNGYLVDPFDTKQFAHGITWILSDKNRREELRKNARDKIERECNEIKIAQEYKMMYESILENK